MVKKLIQVEKTVCDVCGEEAHYTCLHCGKDFCFEHGNRGVEYRCGTHFSGSGDGFFCRKCDADLYSLPHDRLFRLHEAYVAIEGCRDDERMVYEAFQEKRELLEELLTSVQERLRDK